MSETTAAPKRRYRKFTLDEQLFMLKRFSERAMPATVLAEMQASFGHEFKYNAVFYHWKRWTKANKPSGAGGEAQGRA